MNKKASLRQFWQNFFHGIALNNFEISLLHEVHKMENHPEIDKHRSIPCHFLNKTKLLETRIFVPTTIPQTFRQDFINYLIAFIEHLL